MNILQPSKDSDLCKPICGVVVRTMPGIPCGCYGNAPKPGVTILAPELTVEQISTLTASIDAATEVSRKRGKTRQSAL